MHDLQILFAQRLYSGLKRRSIVKCSQWSEMYRVMGKPFPGPWSFKYHPWARKMHDTKAHMVVGQKSAQAAFTETVLNKTFFNIDILGNSVLYLLPTADHASDFSSSRFDVALELSQHLRSIFSDTKNVAHKRAGSANLFVRGSQSRGKLKSDPVAFLVLDEVDEMNHKNIPLAWARLDGQHQDDQQIFLISTPTIDEYGINKYFNDSDQQHFFFKCPHCTRLTELIYPDCLVVVGNSITDSRITESFIKCKECDHKLSHDNKYEYLADGIWVPTYEQRPVEGYYINQLYSSTVAPYKIAEMVIRANSDPAAEQELFNSKLGLTKVVKGAKIQESDIKSCTRSFQQLQRAPENGLVTMGIDVGKWLHCSITQWFFINNDFDVTLATMARLIREVKVENFEDLDNLMRIYNVAFGVIDANPERRKAKEFAERFYPRVKMCYYLNNIKTRDMTLHDEEHCSIGVDRTSWLDVTLGRFKSNKIELPIDLSLEYKKHVMAMVRIYQNDKNGNPTGRYVTGSSKDREGEETMGNADDHYAHAQNYAEIALPLACSMAKSENIMGVL